MGVMDKVMGMGRAEVVAAEQALTFDDLYRRAADADASREADVAPSTLTPQSSLLPEAGPGERTDFAETQTPGQPFEPLPSGSGLPLIGAMPAAIQQRILFALIAFGLLGLVLMIIVSFASASRGAAQVGAAGQALMQSQRLAKSVSQALVGSAAAFAEVRESAEVLTSTLRGLKSGDGPLGIAPRGAQGTIDTVMPLIDRAEKNAGAVLAQQKVLTQVGGALRAISHQSAELLESAETIQSIKLQQGASPAELGAVAQLVMLTQRIGKSASEFLTTEGVSQEAVFLLGKDLNSFRDIATGLADGSSELRLPPARDGQSRDRLAALLRQYETTRAQAGLILGNLQGITSARAAQAAIVADSEPLRKGLEDVQGRLSAEAGFSAANVLALVLFGGLLALGATGFLRLYVRDQALRAALSEQQRASAEREQQEAKRVNDANQAAILRLMNELQTVAEGDLTQQATVTEDITGAIADSINYALEALRGLVATINDTAVQVDAAARQTQATTTHLAEASVNQSKQINTASQSITEMAKSIEQVSANAERSAKVAAQSVEIAHKGGQAVRRTIDGMNSIRETIQETSKRIKRLGESSQEIGDSVELINDISAQPNILALNAAIQASMAGEAGRGFAVVADEVQRLAERSANATRQIEALVKTIQTDTNEAVISMEQSTAGVVGGAQLAENAGSALDEIEKVANHIATLVQSISNAARQQAQTAGDVSRTMNVIREITAQTTEGTNATAVSVGKLAALATEMRKSVAGFKLPSNRSQETMVMRPEQAA